MARARCVLHRARLAGVMARLTRAMRVARGETIVGRWIVLLSVLAIVAVTPMMSATAQDPTPLAPPAATPTPDVQVDLAALTLRPSDLARLDVPGFGLANESSLRDAATDAIIQSGGDAIEVTERLHAYRESGFRYRYVGSLLRPRSPLTRLPSGLVAAEQRITTAVSEFETAEGAGNSFAFTEELLDGESGQIVPGSRTLGDRSRLMRSTGYEIETGAPLQRLELSFRIHNFVAEVIVVDYNNVEPEVATVERLGKLLLSRVEQAPAETGPHFSPRVLRIAPLVPWIEKGRVRDFYVRFAGIDEPMFAQLINAPSGDQATPAATPVPGDAALLPQDTYMFWTPVGEGNPLDLPLYVDWIDRYATPLQAAAALEAVTTDLGPGYVNVRELTGVTETIGDASRAFAYRYEGDPAGPVRGHVVIAQVGSTIIRVQVDGPEGVRRAGVLALAREQVVCLQTMDACEPAQTHDVLDTLLADSA